ncbi:MAG TPA: PD-(D/E)XK nuclease family protein, partial [Tepidiformaceae bacterium]|nr:PD-(D/E)XK nuclease family protein [Tepidiformaceae bacterium]
ELESADPYQKLSGGKLLQLPVYALAVKEMAAGAPVAAQYWFVSEREQFAHRTVELTSSTEAAFRDVVGRFVRTIREGYFPPVPGIEDRDSWKNCQYCPYDAICPGSHRLELWNQWKEDAGLVEFVELVDGTAGKGADDDFDPAA